MTYAFDNLFEKAFPGRIIALGFLFYILLGSLLLMLPCSLQPGIALPYLDALYTATSAVCVTGLNVIDPGSTFSPFGQFVLGCLIQIGGLVSLPSVSGSCSQWEKDQSERTPCYP